MDAQNSSDSKNIANGHNDEEDTSNSNEQITDKNLKEPHTEGSDSFTSVNTNSTISDTESGRKDEVEDGDMPDLLWPDKKGQSPSVKTSESRDTGFGSDSFTETPTPSPGDEQKSLGQCDDIADEKEDNKDENEDRKVMDILGNGLLVKKIIVPGKGVESRPKHGDSVTIRVDGLLEDGTHVDVQDFNFVLGDGDVIVAFDIAVALMEEEEKCELTTGARYAYDEQGREPDVPKDAAITYTIKLVTIESAVDPSSFTVKERLASGESKRERGNYLYGRQDFSGAINSYSKAVKVIDTQDAKTDLSEAALSSLSECWVKCYNNMAACQLKINAHDAAIRSCEKVLAVQDNNVKALFRLGKAYGFKNEVDEALKYVKKAIKLDPESKMLHQEVLALSRRKSKETDTERELYQRMLGVQPEPTTTQTKTSTKPESTSSLKKWALAAGGVAAVFASMGMAYYRMA